MTNYLQGEEEAVDGAPKIPDNVKESTHFGVAEFEILWNIKIDD